MYDKFVELDKNFKSSVNLQYDLFNRTKIKNYIPTTDLCDVIMQYASNILSKDKSRSTLLVGPYGKGKSYLLLLLCYLFSQPNKDDLYYDTIKKISNINKELANKLITINEKEKFLTVIVTCNEFGNLTQSFILGLKNALKDNGINNILPNSTFEECIRIVNKWKFEKTNSFDIVKECLDKTQQSLDELELGLRNYDEKAYENFTKLFECVSHGYPFDPLINNDFGTIYEGVALKIKELGYTGIFTIFDEFGVFLENQSGDFALRLNMVQSFAEKCNSSSDSSCQLHFCCITHKKIELYQKNDKSNINEFQKIAGRFREIRFDRSLEENYQLICGAIVKKDGYRNKVQNEYENDKSFIDRVKASTIFNNNDVVDFLYHNGYPFNPVSIFVLNSISEKVAQNERTLFTFLSDTEEYSFNYFISNNNEGLLNVAFIYNYFDELISSNVEYKDISIKLKTLCKLVSKKELHDILKCIATFKIINDDVLFPCTIENLSLCMHLSIEEIIPLIENLISLKCIKKNINNNCYDFAIIADNEVNNFIEDLIATKYSGNTISELLNQHYTNQYFISSKYNFEYQMTRYCKGIYLETSKFLMLSDLSVYNKAYVCDGLVINLINDNNSNAIEVSKHIKKLNCKNIIARYKSYNFPSEILNNIRKIFAIKELTTRNKLDDTTKSLLHEMLQDLDGETKDYLNYFYIDADILNSYNIKTTNLQTTIYEVFKQYFNKTIVLNNEQINKNIISSVSIKARNSVIDDYLKDTKKDFGMTSAEATIKKSFEIALNLNKNTNIVKKIVDWIKEGKGEKKNLRELISILQNCPYGMRLGIIPLFIAKALSSLSCKEDKTQINSVTLYNENSEIEINAENLTKITIYPNKYYILFNEVNYEKLEMFKELCRLFSCSTNGLFNDQLHLLVFKIRQTISNLEPIIIKSNANDNLLNLSHIELEFKDKLLMRDINNYELLFSELPTMFNGFSNVHNGISSCLANYQNKIDLFYSNVIAEIKILFGFPLESIKSNYDMWKNKYANIDNIIFDNAPKKIYNALNTIRYDDKEAINKIAISSVGCTLDNFNLSKNSTFFNNIKEFISFVDNNKNTIVEKEDLLDNSFDEISVLGKTLYDNLRDSLDEYGESIGNEEKTKILRKLLNDILK